MDRGMMGGKALLYLNAWGSRWLFQCEMYTPLLNNLRSSSCQVPPTCDDSWCIPSVLFT